MSESLIKEKDELKIEANILNNEINKENEEKDNDKSINERKIDEEKEKENKEKEINESEEESEEQDDEIEFGAMGNNKIKFLSKEELNKIKERKLLKEEHYKIEK